MFGSVSLSGSNPALVSVSVLRGGAPQAYPKFLVKT
jgi:hypothetical protein